MSTRNLGWQVLKVIAIALGGQMYTQAHDDGLRGRDT